MVLPFISPRCVDSAIAGFRTGEEPSGEKVIRLIQIRLTTSSLEKILLDCQDETLQARIADSSSARSSNRMQERRER
jgi:hypothetical protein